MAGARGELGMVGCKKLWKFWEPSIGGDWNCERREGCVERLRDRTKKSKVIIASGCIERTGWDHFEVGNRRLRSWDCNFLPALMEGPF